MMMKCNVHCLLSYINLSNLHNAQYYIASLDDHFIRLEVTSVACYNLERVSKDVAACINNSLSRYLIPSACDTATAVTTTSWKEIPNCLHGRHPYV